MRGHLGGHGPAAELDTGHLGHLGSWVSWDTLDTKAGTIGTTAGGGAGAWLLYRGGENYTPALAPAVQ